MLYVLEIYRGYDEFGGFELEMIGSNKNAGGEAGILLGKIPCLLTNK